MCFYQSKFKIKRIQGKKTPTSSILKSSKIFKTNQDKAKILSTTFKNNSATSNYSINFQTNKVRMENITKLPLDSKLPSEKTDFNIPFKLQEMIDAFRNRKGTAPGPDKFSYIFKHMPNSTLNLFLELFNLIWKEGYIPLDWKCAEVFGLPRKEKDLSNPTSYRPISLTSSICKTMEAMVNFRLTHVLETNNLISKYQSGFRKQHSTHDHLIRLQTEISNAFRKKRLVTGIVIDIEKAYDMFGVTGCWLKPITWVLRGGSLTLLKMSDSLLLKVQQYL